jgi:acetoin:2,6-dichlorophenolindophenol oxidoreductase subunit alpha
MEPSKELMIKLYSDLVRVRKLDEKMIECLYAGKFLTFYHSCQGQEAPGVALCAHLRQDDYVFYNHRGHGINKCLPKGMTAREIIAEHYGKATGGARGYAGFHYADMNVGIPGMGGMVAGEITLAAGVGLSCKLRGKGQVVASCFGDGATGRGTLHEAMVMAATWKLPVIWFCENNLYQQWTCLKVTHPREDLADFADGYGIPSVIVDGQDVAAVYEAVGPAVERARAGKGPTFLEVKTYRFRPHVEGMPDYSVQCEGGVRAPEEVEIWKKRDPIKLFHDALIERGYLSEADAEKIEQAAQEEMDEAARFAAESEYPDPSEFDKVLYAE